MQRKFKFTLRTEGEYVHLCNDLIKRFKVISTFFNRKSQSVEAVLSQY